MKDLTAGIIGFGYTGRLHRDAYEKNGVRVTGVAEPQPDVLNAGTGRIQQFTDYCDLLESNIDIVSICTPTGLHCEQTLAALAAGKHVLLEKPIATTGGRCGANQRRGKAIG